MPLSLTWVPEGSFDRVAHTRLYCYEAAGKELTRYREMLRERHLALPGAYLLASHDGVDVGTATSLPLHLWVRGGRVSCQGVAWVGTVQTHRRRSDSHAGGVATQIMREMLREGRERERVVSALMPFRASFYEHFGYGLAELRHRWTLPLGVLPGANHDSIGLLRPEDLPAPADARQRFVEQGQCDIERPPGLWDFWLKKWDEGFTVVDRGPAGAFRGYAAIQRVHENGKDELKVIESGYEDTAALLRLLSFLGSLRDQATFATLTLPADVPLNFLLRESQLPHRAVNHAHATLHPQTRMQVRVLDHRKLLEAMRFDADVRAKVTVAVKETEGSESRFTMDVSDGRCDFAPSQATPDVICTDKIWASLVSGAISPTAARRLNFIDCDPSTARALDFLAEGPAPFCQEYF